MLPADWRCCLQQLQLVAEINWLDTPPTEHRNTEVEPLLDLKPHKPHQKVTRFYTWEVSYHSLQKKTGISTQRRTHILPLYTCYTLSTFSDSIRNQVSFQYAFCCCCLDFSARSHYVDQAASILLPLPPKCWDYSCALTTPDLVWLKDKCVQEWLQWTCEAKLKTTN
jgi:hypothetical protein